MYMMIEKSRSEEMKQMLNIAWAAGFIDGEGCICILKQKYLSSDGGQKVYYRLSVSISQNNLEVLQRVKEVSGEHGNIFARKRTIQTNRQCYTLNYDSKHALNLIRTLKPFLIRKRAEVDAIEQFWQEGRMEERTGRKPVKDEILAVRESWYRKLQRMK